VENACSLQGEGATGSELEEGMQVQVVPGYTLCSLLVTGHGGV